MNRLPYSIVFSILIFLVIGFILIEYYWLGNPRLYLTNVGKSSIDSIEVVVSGNTYNIGTLPSGSTKMIRVDPLTDSDIKLHISNTNKTLIINTYLDRASTGGYIEASITQDSLISFTHKRGLL